MPRRHQEIVPSDNAEPPTVRVDRQAWSPRGMLVAAAAAGAVALLLPLLPGPTLAQAAGDLLQFGAATTAALACFLSARHRTGADRAGWALLAAGAASWALGQAVWTWSEVVLRIATPIPSASDAGFLLMAPLAMAGLLRLSMAHRSHVVTGALLLDGLLATLGAFVLLWPMLLQDAFLAEPDRLAALLIVSYPLMDIALLGMATGVLMRGRGAWKSPLGLLYVGFVLITAADIGLAIGMFSDSYATGDLPDLGWIIGFFLVGAAARLPPPAAPAVSSTATARRDVVVIAGRVFPVVAVVLGFIGFGWQMAQGDLPGRPWRIAMALLVAAALSRQVIFTQEYVGAVRQRERAYDDLRRSERAVRVMSKVNQAVVRANDEGRLMQRVCDLLVADGYRRAWIARSDNADGVALQVLARAGPLPADGPWRPDPTDPAGLAIRDGLPQIAQRLPDLIAPAPWQEDAMANGCKSRCALPLALGGQRGVLVVCSADPEAFGPDEVHLLQDLAAELSYGLAALRERQAREVAEAARRREMDNYEGIVESASDGIFRVAPAGQLLFANQTGARMLGYGSPADMMAAGINMAQVYEDPKQRAVLLDRVARGDRTPFETRMRRLDGSTFWAALRVRSVRGADGAQELVGTMEDITDRKAAEEAQEALARQDLEVKRLEELNRMRMDFLNAAAHDLKTPLTPLKLQMAMLRKDATLGPTQRAGLDLMDRNIGRFQVLIEDMLDVARLQAGRLKLRREPAPLPPLVREAVMSFQESARQARLSFEVDPMPDVRIDADPMKCMQVLMNLVSNAVKYTPHGGAVSVGIDVHEREAVVRIRDTGIGLSAAQLTCLFQPFVRLHEDRPDVAKGTGLGLYISKGIVEQHGGRLWAESPGPEKGATFYVAWPLAGHGPPPAKPMAAA